MEVYNWHLGRKMYYPYEEVHPKRQFVAVFNTNRCIGCQTCTMACKSTWTFSKGMENMWWNNVETKPYGGYPQFWDVKTLKLIEDASPGKQRWSAAKRDDSNMPYGVFEGYTAFEASTRAMRQRGQHAVGYLPAEDEWIYPNIYEDTPTWLKGEAGVFGGDGVSLPEHNAWFFHLQRICNHCTYPACLAACPRKAIYKRPEDGIVLIDQKRCRGYKKCIEQCPYKKPMFRGSTRISEKCIACYPRVEGKDPLTNGHPMETRCMTACVGKIRLQGLVRKEGEKWTEDRYNPLYYLIKVEKAALPLYPQFGTEPNVYYIPPRWVPRSYLRQMFGPGADEAVEKYLAPSRELLAVLQLFRITQKIIFSYRIEEGQKVYETTIHGKKFEMYNDTIIGFGADGKEVVRTTVEEPKIVRAPQYYNAI